MCLGNLPLLYGEGLNDVLYPRPDWQAHYLANEKLEYRTMELFLQDTDRRELPDEWAKAAEFLYSAGRRGICMTESLALDALEIWCGCRTYRQMNCNLGVDYTQVPQQMVELLGGTRWSFSTGDVTYKGWYEENFKPTKKFLAEFHVRFERIHPLFDGNGRWGRLLLVHGYGRMSRKPALIVDREAYLDAIRKEDVQELAKLL